MITMVLVLGIMITLARISVRVQARTSTETTAEYPPIVFSPVDGFWRWAADAAERRPYRTIKRKIAVKGGLSSRRTPKPN